MGTGSARAPCFQMVPIREPRFLCSTHSGVACHPFQPMRSIVPLRSRNRMVLGATQARRDFRFRKETPRQTPCPLPDEGIDITRQDLQTPQNRFAV